MPQFEASNFSDKLKQFLSAFNSVSDRWETKQGHSLGTGPGTQQENLGISVICSKPKAKYLHLDYSKTFCLPSQLLFLCGMEDEPLWPEGCKGDLTSSKPMHLTSQECCTNSGRYISTHHDCQAFFLPGPLSLKPPKKSFCIYNLVLNLTHYVARHQTFQLTLRNSEC